MGAVGVYSLKDKLCALLFLTLRLTGPLALLQSRLELDWFRLKILY